MRPTRRRCLAGLTGALAALPACRRQPQPQVNVGAKTGTEQAFLAAAIALHLESVLGPGRAIARPALGGSAVTHETLLASQIDLYPEYTGLALTALLGLASDPDPAKVLQQVKANYRIRFRCEWTTPLGFSNPPVLVTTEAIAHELGGLELSRAALAKKPWRLGAQREFLGRRDGLPMLMAAYKLPLSGPVQTMERDQLYAALDIGQITLAAGEALDPGARRPGMAILTDDHHAFPPYEAGLAVSLDILERLPGLLAALKPLEGRFPFGRLARAIDEIERAAAAARENPEAPPPDLRAFARGFLREAGLHPPQ